MSIMPNLKFVQGMPAGFDAFTKYPIWTNDLSMRWAMSNGASAATCAQWAVGQIYNLTMGTRRLMRAQERRERVHFDRDYQDPSMFVTLSGMRVGILGYGKIGRQGKRTLEN
jgi:phosphoglycerate dehydrogenase-like enzyme